MIRRKKSNLLSFEISQITQVIDKLRVTWKLQVQCSFSFIINEEPDIKTVQEQNSICVASRCNGRCSCDRKQRSHAIVICY